MTVVGRSLTWADIDATAAFALGADAARWLTTRGAPRRVRRAHGRDDRHALTFGPRT